MRHYFSALSELNRSTDMLKGISESYNSYRMGLISASSLEDYDNNSNDCNQWKKGIRFKARS